MGFFALELKRGGERMVGGWTGAETDFSFFFSPNYQFKSRRVDLVICAYTGDFLSLHRLPVGYKMTFFKTQNRSRCDFFFFFQVQLTLTLTSSLSFHVGPLLFHPPERYSIIHWLINTNNYTIAAELELFFGFEHTLVSLLLLLLLHRLSLLSLLYSKWGPVRFLSCTWSVLSLCTSDDV